MADMLRHGLNEDSKKSNAVVEVRKRKSAKNAKSAKSAKMCKKCGNRKLCEKSAESAVLLGDVAALHIILTKQPNSY
jgi:hypothetical protein